LKMLVGKLTIMYYYLQSMLQLNQLLKWKIYH
jgi:hypothetical protein